MEELKFTKTHEWVKIEADIVVIGITDYAQRELGDIVFVELPLKGDKLIQGRQFATVESTKAAAEIYAPLTGEVVEINGNLAAAPQLINESPLDKGWMVKIRLEDSGQPADLLTESEYREFIDKESK
ncbi:MAG: glycine cleavage system protein GcvH [Candidatus Omnitrophota bacterium]